MTAFPNWRRTRNGGRVDRADIPVRPLPELAADVAGRCRDGLRLAALFGVPEGAHLGVLAVLADDARAELWLSAAEAQPGEAYPAITRLAPAAHVFERELWEAHGLRPEGHPWLKPVRYAHDRFDRGQTMESYPFFSMEGEEVHEVAVGPVHAGVIEPGHFRFMCTGEQVHHLEIQLGYQHRGVEQLLEGHGRTAHPFRNRLAESLAGDTAVGHALAYAAVMEAMLGLDVPSRGALIRDIALELERMSVHAGDLAAIANDVAYLTGNAVFGALRTRLINTSLAACGSRFGRGWVQTGGVRGDLDAELARTIGRNVAAALADLEQMAETFFSSASVLSRLERTGIVRRESAERIGLLGMAARACGVPRDCRADHPWGGYAHFPLAAITLDGGDVHARSCLRRLEIRQSAEIIRQRLSVLPEGGTLRAPAGPLPADSVAVALVEGWRGEILHAAVTGRDGGVIRYRVQDPSLLNWFGLALAVRRNGVSDFPLCNKSFNLSYCGHDL
jgi:Ni,Fe-hydrogenase III large subunit